jgi:hypothetical protein
VQAYLPCAAHNLQLVLKDGFKLDEIFEKLLEKVKKIVASCRRSTIVADELRQFGKTVQKNNITRWNSILFMIRSVNRLRGDEMKLILSIMNAKIKDKSKRHCLTKIKFDMLLELQDVLEYF